jgi:hypothetical protein
MGLPIEIWVAVGLGIFILSVVGILYKWWDENQRIPAGQGQGTRSQIAEPERIQAALSHVKSLRPSSEQSLVPQDVYYFHDTTPGRGYPHKVWIVLRNAGRRDLFVSPAKWETSTGDIATRPISQHPWTPEVLADGKRIVGAGHGRSVRTSRFMFPEGVLSKRGLGCLDHCMKSNCAAE